MKKLLTLLLFLAPAIMARAEEVTLCLRDLSGGVMSEFPFQMKGYENYTTDAEGCATVDLSPGENQIQYDHGFTNFEWDGTQTRVDVTIDDGYWMTVQLTGVDESEKDALVGAVFKIITDGPSDQDFIGEDLTLHFWLSSTYVQGNKWSYQIHSPKYPTPRTYVDLAATGNHPTINLREGRTPVDITRPIGVDGTPLTGDGIDISQRDDRDESLSTSIPLDEIPEGGVYRSWMVPGTYDFSFTPEENYLSRRMPVTVGAEPATVAFDLSQSVQLNVHLIGYDGKPIADRYVDIYSIDRTTSGSCVSMGSGRTNAEGIATVYAMPGSYRAQVLFYHEPLFPYPTDPCGETYFDVPAGETAEATVSFENYTAFIATIKGLDKENIGISCNFEDEEGNYYTSLDADLNFEGEGRRYGTLVQMNGPMSGRIVVNIYDMSAPENSSLYVKIYHPVATTEGGVFAEMDLSTMQEVTLRAPEGYRFYEDLIIDGERYAYGYSDTGDPFTAITAHIMPGEHTWQATLTSLDGSTRYPMGTVQTFTVGDAPMDVTYAFDAADYPGLRLTVKGVNGTPAAGFYAALENIETGEGYELSIDAEGHGTFFTDNPGTYLVEVGSENDDYLPQGFIVELNEGLTERTVSFEGWHSFTLQMPDLWQYSQERSSASVTWTSATDPNDLRNGYVIDDEWDEYWDGPLPEIWTIWMPAGNLSVRYTASDANNLIVNATSQTAMPNANTTYAIDLSGYHRVSFLESDGSDAFSMVVELQRIESDGRHTPTAGYLLPEGTYMAYYFPYGTGADSYFRENCDSVSFTVAGADIEVRFNVSEDDYIPIGLIHRDTRNLYANLGVPGNSWWARVDTYVRTTFYLLPGRKYTYYVSSLTTYDDNDETRRYDALPEPRSLYVDGEEPYIEIPLSDYRLIDLRGTLDGTPVDGFYIISATGGLTAGNDAYGSVDARFALRPGSYNLVVQRYTDGTLLYGRVIVTDETTDGSMTVELSTEPTGIHDVATGSAALDARPAAGGLTISGAAGSAIGVDVYTADGRLALRTTAADGETIGTGLPAGVYVVRLTQGSTAKTQRVLVR